MIGNILDNTTELYMIKYTFGEIFNSSGATLCKNPSDQTVWLLFRRAIESRVVGVVHMFEPYEEWLLTETAEEISV